MQLIEQTAEDYKTIYQLTSAKFLSFEIIQRPSSLSIQVLEMQEYNHEKKMRFRDIERGGRER